jgi:hypothetical protein
MPTHPVVAVSPGGSGAQPSRRSAQQGAALLLSLMLVLAMGVAVAALVPLATTERLLARVAREAAVCRYAAEAIAWYAVAELQAAGDWNTVLNGSRPPSFSDVTRVPTLAGGLRVDLDGFGAAFPATEPGAWGANRPRWRLLAWGPARNLARGVIVPEVYVAVWVADDERDGDGDPERDTNGRVHVRGEAFGPVRGRRSTLLTVERQAPAPAALRLVDWQVP